MDVQSKIKPQNSSNRTCAVCVSLCARARNEHVHVQIAHWIAYAFVIIIIIVLLFIFAYALAFNYKFGFVSMIYCIWGGVTGCLPDWIWCILTIFILQTNKYNAVNLLVNCAIVSYSFDLCFFCLSLRSFPFQCTPLKCWWFCDEMLLIDWFVSFCFAVSLSLSVCLCAISKMSLNTCIYIITIKSSYIWITINWDDTQCVNARNEAQTFFFSLEIYLNASKKIAIPTRRNQTGHDAQNKLIAEMKNTRATRVPNTLKFKWPNGNHLFFYYLFLRCPFKRSRFAITFELLIYVRLYA